MRRGRTTSPPPAAIRPASPRPGCRPGTISSWAIIASAATTAATGAMSRRNTSTAGAAAVLAPVQAGRYPLTSLSADSIGDARAVLALEDGRVFPGVAFGAAGIASGEVVFNTAHCGYQEILTDPSYKGQIVVMTVPHVGNYGVNEEDLESERPRVAASSCERPRESLLPGERRVRSRSTWWPPESWRSRSWTRGL